MQQPQNLKLLYLSVLNGYSESVVNRTPVFIKHSRVRDELVSEIIYEREYKKCQDAGLETEAQRLEFLKKTLEWTDVDEKNLSKNRDYLESLRNTRVKVVKSQLSLIEENIKKVTSEIIKSAQKRDALMGDFCEKRASKVRDEASIQTSVFSDRELSSLKYSVDDWDDLDDLEVREVGNAYYSSLGALGDENLKKLAVLPTFFNFFCLSDKDNSASFFNTSASNLTIPQYRLLVFAKNVQFTLDNVPDIPASAKNDYDALMSISEGHFNPKKKGKKTSDNGDRPMSPSDLTEILKKSKKTSLSKNDILSH